MVPTVTKIIHISKLEIYGWDNLIQLIAALIHHRLPIFRTGNTVTFVLNDEFVKMAICPTHSNLDDLVQCIESG